MPRLLIKSSQGKLERFELSPGEYRVGREADCELQLPNVSVSRVHAVLKVGKGWTTVEDAGSSNGILVNDQKVQDVRLYSADEITIGRYTLVYLGDGHDDQFYKGRCVKYLQDYKPAPMRTEQVGAEATFAMSKEDLQRMSGMRRLVDDGKLVLVKDPNKFWFPESKTLTLGGSGSMVRTEGLFHLGTVAEVKWNGKQHVVEKKAWWVGMRVNDQAVQTHALKHGDVLRVGNTSFRYEEPEDPGARKRPIPGRTRAETWTPGS